MKLKIKKSYGPGRWYGHWSKIYRYGFYYLPGYVVILKLNQVKKPTSMAYEGPELDKNYTPEEVSGVKVHPGVIVGILILLVFVVMAVFFPLGQKRDDHIVTDSTTVSTAERPPIGTVKIRTDVTRYFYPGDTLSSKPNGALILWEEWMGIELIVGVVSDSGIIEEVKHTP